MAAVANEPGGTEFGQSSVRMCGGCVPVWGVRVGSWVSDRVWRFCVWRACFRGEWPCGICACGPVFPRGSWVCEGLRTDCVCVRGTGVARHLVGVGGCAGVCGVRADLGHLWRPWGCSGVRVCIREGGAQLRAAGAQLNGLYPCLHSRCPEPSPRVTVWEGDRRLSSAPGVARGDERRVLGRGASLPRRGALGLRGGRWGCRRGGCRVPLPSSDGQGGLCVLEDASSSFAVHQEELSELLGT